MREREGLIARIRQIRRVAAATDRRGAANTAEPDSSHADVLEGLEARVAHLEQLLEGLQDSVHRESDRQGKLIAELQAQIQPAALNAALTKDARERGL